MINENSLVITGDIVDKLTPIILDDIFETTHMCKLIATTKNHKYSSTEFF